jgi:hypothetical protein
MLFDKSDIEMEIEFGGVYFEERNA